MKKFMLATFLSGLWLNTNEFVRNEILFKEKWIIEFQKLGLIFPSEPLNGLIWVMWGFVFCGVLTILVKNLSCLKSSVLAWIQGFGLMWIACVNLGVFPIDLLFVAIPWSFIEVYIAALISIKILKKNKTVNVAKNLRF